MKERDKKLEARAAAIAACRDKSGRVTLRAVVEEARDPASPNHEEFEWDNEKAADRDRLRTAAELIRSVKFIINYEDRTIVAPFYVSDPSRETSAYIATAFAAKSHARSEAVLRDELARIIGAVRRAMTLAEVFGLQSSFERMLSAALEVERELDGGGGDDAGSEARV